MQEKREIMAFNGDGVAIFDQFFGLRHCTLFASGIKTRFISQCLLIFILSPKFSHGIVGNATAKKNQTYKNELAI